MDVRDAFSLIAHAIDTGTTANGYLVVGGVRDNAAELTEKILGKLFPDEPEQIAAHAHPDVVWLEPEGKSRTIHVGTMRENLIAPMAVTAFSGGWKVGIVVGADRMEVTAANAFLKSLEEPTPKTLYLLLTDAPDAVLATIVSRCQRIDLKLPAGILEGEAYEQVSEVMTANIGTGIFEKVQAGKRLAEILTALKDEAADEDVAMVRKAFYKTILSFVRDWMVEGRLPRYQAFRNIEAVEEAARQSDRSMNDESVLTFLTDRLTFPAA